MIVFKGKKLSSERVFLAFLSLLAFKWTFVQKPSQQWWPIRMCLVAMEHDNESIWVFQAL